MGYIRDIYFTHFLTFDPNFLGDPTIHDLDPFFLPLQMVLASLGLIVAASGGIGGGGILVPLFMLVLELRPSRNGGNVSVRMRRSNWGDHKAAKHQTKKKVCDF